MFLAPWGCWTLFWHERSSWTRYGHENLTNNISFQFSIDLHCQNHVLYGQNDGLSCFFMEYYFPWATDVRIWLTKISFQFSIDWTGPNHISIDPSWVRKIQLKGASRSELQQDPEHTDLGMVLQHLSGACSTLFEQSGSKHDSLSRHRVKGRNNHIHL